MRLKNSATSQLAKLNNISFYNISRFTNCFEFIVFFNGCDLIDWTIIFLIRAFELHAIAIYVCVSDDIVIFKFFPEYFNGGKSAQ